MKTGITILITVILIAVNTISINTEINREVNNETTYIEDTRADLEASIETVVTNTNTSMQETVVQNNNITYGYIFIGDSRFVGMNTYYNIDTELNHYMIASVGQGYDYLINEALPNVDNIIGNNSEVDNWKLIICLGVNDLYNLDMYTETYKNIKDKYNLVLVSVNPIEYHNSITNITIETFNENLQNIEGIQYIDTYTHLNTIGFTTTDGIHYTKETYGDILNIINQYK